MGTTSAGHATAHARRASRGTAAHVLARAGLTARGIIYLLIGFVAIEVAIGHGRHEADQSGALNLLARQPFGLVLLWLLAIGFAAYALWRLSEAAFGVTGDKPGAGPRLKSLARAVVYAGFAYLTFSVIAGRRSSQSHKQQDLTARVMQHTGGQWLVGIAGLIVVIVAVVLIVEGVRRTFLKYLKLGQLSPRARRIVEWLGVIGTCARGIVFGLAGVLVIEAAVTHKPSKAGGIDKALLTLRGQPLGEVLLFVAALGLVIFGVYGLCEARWRKV
ncbi:MAG TPA: DUF1206 domain-containing protein [Streptosporangiaceae bacterium]|jgi:uncharacterized integral membrane protein